MSHPVNKVGIQFANMRFGGTENLDENFLDLKDDITALWYASNFEKYNRHYGILWTLYNFVFDQLNLERVPEQRIPQARYRYRDPDQPGPPIDTHEDFTQILLAHPVEAAEMEARIEAKFGRAFQWP